MPLTTRGKQKYEKTEPHNWKYLSLSITSDIAWELREPVSIRSRALSKSEEDPPRDVGVAGKVADAARRPPETLQNVREESRPLLSRVASEGKAGAEIARLIERAGDLGDVGAGKPVACFDDDPSKLGHRRGVPILGPLAGAPDLAESLHIGCAILAMPGVSQDRLTTILDR